jgi:hypothetical protein
MARILLSVPLVVLIVLVGADNVCAIIVLLVLTRVLINFAALAVKTLNVNRELISFPLLF